MPAVVVNFHPDSPAVSSREIVLPKEYAATAFMDIGSKSGKIAVVRCLPDNLKTEVHEAELKHQVEVPEDQEELKAFCAPFIEVAFMQIELKDQSAHTVEYEDPLTRSRIEQVVRHSVAFAPPILEGQ